jgi:hypothetical protein
MKQGPFNEYLLKSKYIPVKASSRYGQTHFRSLQDPNDEALHFNKKITDAKIQKNRKR